MLRPTSCIFLLLILATSPAFLYAAEKTSAAILVKDALTSPNQPATIEAKLTSKGLLTSNPLGGEPLELVVDGKTGFSFCAGDIEDLSIKLIQAAAAFVDVGRTTDECLRVIADYTPERSARQTLDGCIRIAASHA